MNLAILIKSVSASLIFCSSLIAPSIVTSSVSDDEFDHALSQNAPVVYKVINNYSSNKKFIVAMYRSHV